MDLIGLLVVGLTILAYGVVSKRAERSILSPPMAFVTVGLLAGPLGFGLIEFSVEEPFVHLLAEVTLVLVLFIDASRISFARLRSEHDLPVRLLTLGMPLTILAGAVAAALLFESLSIWECAVLAAILAPTDAALGLAVINDKRVPVRIRQTLNVESGLNDGIAFPVFLIFLSLAGAPADGMGAAFWARFIGLQLVLGPLVGLAVGALGGRLIHGASESGWMNHTFQALSGLGLALVAFAGAEIVGGNGFISAFVAGLACGNSARTVCTCLWDFGEEEGQLLALFVFLVLGAVLVPEAVHGAGWMVFVYAALSLTIVRIVPVALALMGTGVSHQTCGFVGWFGPRGIASVVFVLLVLEHPGIPGGHLIFSVAVMTVLLSVFAHGASAYPGASWYAKRMGSGEDAEDRAENQTVSEMPVRISQGIK